MTPTLKQIFLLACLLTFSTTVFSQYFGKNKPKYEKFDFEVLQTPHFELYHYLEDTSQINTWVSSAEKWYHLHQEIFSDSMLKNNPWLLYSDHADFQQTNAIQGRVGVGTGGVTEAFKNRVILPIAMTNQQTDHVIGHELVHAFQYSLILNGDSTNLQSLGNLPLWMVEGLAEYLSIGRTDAHTAMWMRDAVLNNDVPDLRDLNNPKYFPYRWGHSFWAFLTGIQGDGVIKPFFHATAKYGFDVACLRILGLKSKKLSELWVSSIKKHYEPYVGDKREKKIGKKILSDKNAGRMNISPSLSPNGKYVVFFSEKDVFTLDLYLADARNGKIERKIASTIRDGHLDDFNFIESSGTWSPRSDLFAFVAVQKGDNILVIKDIKNGRTKEEFKIEGVPAFSNPAWSPDGKTIVVSGLVDGRTDLFEVNVKSKRVKRLTDDSYSEMHPAWSPDGKKLAFASDKKSRTTGTNYGKYNFNLAVMDLEDNSVQILEVFEQADNVNPVFSNEGDLYFLSNRDGFRNIYKYEFEMDKVYQQTDLLTGVSGITPYAPALSVDGKRDQVVYTHFYDNNYAIYSAQPKQFINQEVRKDSVDMTPARLIQLNSKAPTFVDENIKNDTNNPTVSTNDLQEKKYRSKFKLDFVSGGGGMGVGTNSFGNNTALAGGLTMLFSDMLGDHQFITSLALNGEIYDLGGQLAYINRKNRVYWGAGYSHIPYPSFSNTLFFQDQVTTTNGTFPAIRQTYLVQRTFEDRLDLFAQLPISTTMRVEGGISGAHYGWRIDSINRYYTTDASFSYIGSFVGEEREKLDAPDGFEIYTANTALVGDNSFFGVASPLQGYRYRLGADVNFGAYNFMGMTADARYYKYVKPLSFAARFTHFGRYGEDSDSFFPMYLGYPWYVRGYQTSFVNDFIDKNDLRIDHLLGSKIALAGLEVRLPFTGPERLSLISSKYFLTEFALFLDGGVAWFDYDQFKGNVFDDNDDFQYYEAKPVFSTGLSLRVNLFGALVIEPYISRPLQKETEWIFGMNLQPGW